MSFGQRLKRIRNYRNLTMKELGVRIRIPERQADIRIAQYEADKKMPREDVLKGLAFALDTSVEALDLPDISSFHGSIYNLFEYYQNYGLHPVRINGKVYLEVDKSNSADDLLERLSDWCDEYEEFQAGKITAEQFNEWMLKYPEYSKNLLSNKRDSWLIK